MAARVIATFVPPRQPVLPRPGSSGPSQAVGTPFPLAELPALPRTGSLHYGMGRVDSSGRVLDRSLVRALGWGRDERLHLTLVAGSVVVHRHPAGVFALTSHQYLVLPAPVRRRCGLATGDRVLLAADPNHGVLVVHPLSALDTMITAYHASLQDGEPS